MADRTQDDPLDRKVDEWARKARAEFERASVPETTLDPRVYDRNTRVYDPTERTKARELEKPELRYDPPGMNRAKAEGFVDRDMDKAKRQAEAEARAAEPKPQTFNRAARGDESDGAHSREQGGNGGWSREGGDDGGRSV